MVPNKPKKGRYVRYHGKSSGNHGKSRKKGRKNTKWSEICRQRAFRQNRSRDGRFAPGFRDWDVGNGSIPKHTVANDVGHKVNTFLRTLSKYNDNAFLWIKKLLIRYVTDIHSKSKKKEDEIVDTLASNFSVKEIMMMDDAGKVDIEVVKKIPESDTARGRYSVPKPGSQPTILYIESADESTITHEMIHHMRIMDDSRKGDLKTQHSVSPDKLDHNNGELTYAKSMREERCTHAETALRTSQPTANPSNIFSTINSDGRLKEDSEVNYAIARKILRADNGTVVPDGVSINGDTAKEMFRENYQERHIYPKE